MALTMTPITIEATPSSAVATNGTVTFTYPSGYNAASFVSGGATLFSVGLNDGTRRPPFDRGGDLHMDSTKERRSGLSAGGPGTA